MKTRCGFVSNSSSSSFVVEMKERHTYPMPEENQLTEEQMKTLREYGFSELKDDKNIPQEYRYDVLCNESDVIEFLLKNDIPFEAECHYGHYHVFYYKKTDKVVEAWNYGCEISTYGPDMTLRDYEEANDTNHPAIRVCTRKEYLKNQL